MKNIELGKRWHGRPYTVWTGSIRELKQLIPTFTISDFSIRDGVNEFLSTIAREPLDRIYIVRERDRFGKFLSIRHRETLDEIGRIVVQSHPRYEGVWEQPRHERDKIDDVDEIDPQSDKCIPVAAVRTKYTDSSFQNWKHEDVVKGYKLVEHQKVLGSILGPLKKFSSNCGGDFLKDSKIHITPLTDPESEDSKIHITPLTDPESLDATLQISKYGARMRIECLVPNYKFYLDNDMPYVLKVSCLNSVDKSIALRINLSWCFSLENTGIPIAGFRSWRFSLENIGIPIAGFRVIHDQGLKDGAIEEFLNSWFERLLNGEWLGQFMERKKAEDWLRRKFPTDAKQILAIYAKLYAAYVDPQRPVLDSTGSISGLLKKEYGRIPEADILRAYVHAGWKIYEKLGNAAKESRIHYSVLGIVITLIDIAKDPVDDQKQLVKRFYNMMAELFEKEQKAAKKKKQAIN